MLTKKKAISECKELWKEIDESGLSKDAFLDTPAGKKWMDKEYESDCPLCEYAYDPIKKCPQCPLVKQYGQICFGLGFYGADRNSSFFKAIRELKDE